MERMRYDEEEDDPTPEEGLHAKRKRGEGPSTDPAPNEPVASELEASPAKRAQRESDPLLGVLNASARPRTTHLLVEGRDGGYMPPIGSVPGFVAEPNTALQPGNVLAVVAPMGCGKTTMVAQWGDGGYQFGEAILCGERKSNQKEKPRIFKDGNEKPGRKRVL